MHEAVEAIAREDDSGIRSRFAGGILACLVGDAVVQATEGVWQPPWRCS